MIPSSYKLKLSRNIKFSGKVTRGVFATYVFCSSDLPQWAVQISRRVDKSAVIRNRLRRQINHWLYKHKESIACNQLLIILKSNPQKDFDKFLLELSKVITVKA